eukprot:9157374-Heterocapsa_arctica.AAC.1
MLACSSRLPVLIGDLVASILAHASLMTSVGPDVRRAARASHRRHDGLLRAAGGHHVEQVLVCSEAGRLWKAGDDPAVGSTDGLDAGVDD